MEMKYRLEHLYKSYGNLILFDDFTIHFEPGEINCILGPSGCGKTSLLNIIGGTIKPESGDTSDFHNAVISYVFQDPRLLPWKTVKENISFVLKDKLPSGETEKQAREYIHLMKLDNFADYYPSRLSGGMKQRVSLARAFSYRSHIILMDEPFKALDIKLKDNLMSLFTELWARDRRTVIYVTHEIEEALRMGHKLFIFSNAPVNIEREFYISKNSSKDKLREEIKSLMSS